MEEATYFETLKNTFHAAPITKLIPQRMMTVRKGSVQIVLEPNANTHHGAGRIHGGVLGLLLDNAGFFAAATESGGKWVVTTEYKVNLLASAAGEPVVGEGRVLYRGREIIQCEMSATSQAGVKLAVGLGTYLIMPRDFREQTSA